MLIACFPSHQHHYLLSGEHFCLGKKSPTQQENEEAEKKYSPTCSLWKGENRQVNVTYPKTGLNEDLIRLLQ